MIQHARMVLDPTDSTVICVCGWQPGRGETLAQHLREVAQLRQKLNAIGDKRCGCHDEAGREACRRLGGRLDHTWV